MQLPRLIQYILPPPAPEPTAPLSLNPLRRRLLRRITERLQEEKQLPNILYENTTQKTQSLPRNQTWFQPETSASNGRCIPSGHQSQPEPAA